MGKVYPLNGLNFDDSFTTFDDSFNFDKVLDPILQITQTDTLVQHYIAHEVGFLEIVQTDTGAENYSQYVDLLKYVPEKFRSSVALQQFLAEAGLMVGSWLGDISDLSLLINPYTVDEAYITYLAGLIGFNFQSTSTTPFSQLQRQLIQAVPWYKMKGTYQGYQYIGYSLGLNLNFYDLYTQDYINFIPEPWYAGTVGTLPPDSLLNNLPFVTTSTTSLTVGHGTKTLTVGTGLTFAANQNIAITNSATNYMIGTFTSYNSGTGVMVVNVTNAYGSGTYTSWSVPGGFYKSPHFGLQILLNQVYGTGTASYLFNGANTFNQLTSYINVARPVNTVPQYSLLLVGQTDQTGATTTVAGNVMTAVTPAFSLPSPGFFDDGTTHFDDYTTSQNLLQGYHSGYAWANTASSSITPGTIQLYLNGVLIAKDNGSGNWINYYSSPATSGLNTINYSSGFIGVDLYPTQLSTADVSVTYILTSPTLGYNFDYTNTVFYGTISKWTLGTGNKGVNPDIRGFALQNPIASLTNQPLSAPVIYSDHVTYTIDVPNNTTQANISKLGLDIYQMEQLYK